MNYLEQVQRGIDYIEANLNFDITAAQVAKNAGVSQWHFQRIFTALTNETLKTYIRSRRLTLALNKLLVKDQRIIDIALSAGYETQESFTRAFKKAFNLTPNEFRKLGDKNLFMQKIQFNPEYLKHVNVNVSLTPEIYFQSTMYLVGLKTCFYSVDSAKNNIADKLPPLWSDFLGRINEIKNTVAGQCYGVIQQTKEKTDHLEYFAAIEIKSSPSKNDPEKFITNIPDGMELISVPATQYAKFTHRGNIKNLNSTVDFIYSSWLLQSNKRHTYAADLEIYDQDYLGESDDSTLYYAIPIQ